jgi:hypothetical protein
MTIPREARSQAMRLAGDLVFSASGRRALTELGLMSSGPAKASIPVLSTDTLSDVLQMCERALMDKPLLVIDPENGRIARLDVRPNMGSSEVTDAMIGDPSMGMIVEYLNARVEDANIPRLGRVHGRSHAAELLAG